MSMPLLHADFFAVRVHHTHCNTAIGSPCCAEANLKAAAQAAARKALANVTTVFFDDAHPPATPSVWPTICSAHVMQHLCACMRDRQWRSWMSSKIGARHYMQANQRPPVCCHQPPHWAEAEPRTEQPAPAAPFRRMATASVWWTTGAACLAPCHVMASTTAHFAEAE